MGFHTLKYKGLSKKLLHNYHGLYRIVEKLSPVHYRLCTCTNKPVSTTVCTNRMKLFIDPNDCPITPPDMGDDDLPFLPVDDLPADSFKAPGDRPSLPHETFPRFTSAQFRYHFCRSH